MREYIIPTMKRMKVKMFAIILQILIKSLKFLTMWLFMIF